MGTDPKNEEFLKLYVPMQLSLRSFVAAHVIGFHKAEDVFQEISLVLWNQFDRYDPTRSFEAWAYGVAWNLVMKARRTAARDKHVFSDELAEGLTQRFIATADAASGRGEYLQECMRKLPEDSKAVLAMKYTERRRIDDMASLLGRTENAVRMLLFRIRSALEKCIAHSAENHPAEELKV